MKKVLYLLVPLALLAASCTQELESRMNEAEERLARLESDISSLNTQVSIIRALLSGKYFVQDVTDLSDGSGYRLVLVDENGQRMEKTVLNGKDGETPDVGLRQDSDGHYYWTLNGEWLLVAGGKVRADGEDAPLTEFKVENGKWYAKIGDGQWTYVGDAVTEVRCPIASVDATSLPDAVLFTLSDGTVISVPKASAAVKLQLILDDSVFQSMAPGETRSTAYEVKAPAGISYTLDSYEPQGWKVSFTEPKDKRGILTVTLPVSAEGGKVMLVVNGSDGSCYVRILHVGNESADDTVEVKEVVDAAAGTLNLPAGAVSVVIPESASWIKLSGKQLVFEENSTYDARTAVVSFKVSGKPYVLTVVQAQRDAIVLTENSLTLAPEGEELRFVLLANVEVETSSDVSWLVVAPSTKGLMDKPFTIVAQANESGRTREGVITFSYGKLSQKVTVTQESVVSNPLLSRTLPGLYLKNVERSYAAGTDQYLRSYDAGALTFALLNKEEREQIVLTGFSSAMRDGDAVTLSVNWKKGGEDLMVKSFDYLVLYQEAGQVWIGNAEGEGVIIKK